MLRKQAQQCAYQKKYFKTKSITKDREGLYIMNVKGINTRRSYYTLVNMYAPNVGAPKDIKQILTDIKGEVDNNTIVVGDFNAPLT